MLPYSFIGSGSYTNAASPVAVTVALNDVPDFFVVMDTTNWGANSAGSYTALAQLKSWTYPKTMPAASFLQEGQSAVAVGAASLYGTKGTTNGFTFIDPTNPPTFASLSITSTINHTTWVVGMTNTGSIQVGDWVRIINPTAMLQAGGFTAQVTAVSVNTSITLGYIATAVSNGANFVADATGGSILKYFRGNFYPKAQRIMHITQATQAKVYFAGPNDFTPGELVDFNIPSTYGMTQMNFLTGTPGGAARVLTVTNTATESSITLDVNSVGFTAFAYPTSAGSVGKASPATCFPAGSGIVPLNGSATVPQSPPGTNLQDAFDNRNQYYMYIGTSVVGAGSAVMQWTAYKADYNNLTNA
jgi:hypothetical protein